MSAAKICGATLASSSTNLESNSGTELIPCSASLEEVGSSSLVTSMLPSSNLCFCSGLNISPVVLLCSGASRLREELSLFEDLLMESILLFSSCPGSPLSLMSFASSLPTSSVGYWTGKSSEEGKTISWPLENSIDLPFPSDVFCCSGMAG